MEWRKKNRKAYNKEDIMMLLLQLVNGLKLFRKKNVYHSDIKPDNIVINLEVGIYQFIDFGVGNLVSEESTNGDELDEKEFEIEDLSYGGTDLYKSPEKAKYESVDEDDYDKIDPDLKMFNPFKCDMYSLGKIFQIFQKNKLIENPIQFEYFINKMTDKAWKTRICVGELSNKLEKEMKGVGLYIPELDREIAEQIKQNELKSENILGYRVSPQYEMFKYLHKHTYLFINRDANSKSSRETNYKIFYHKIGLKFFKYF